jgi:hypothetical protein
MMKVHWYWQRWTPVSYGMTNLGKFMHWSSFLEFNGSQLVIDRKKSDYGPGVINWLRKKLNCPECVVLNPMARTDAEFIMGFLSPTGKVCMVAPFSASRHVLEGPFAMRLGPQPVKFFVVGTAEIKLGNIGKIIRGSPEDKAAKDLIIY